MADNSEKGLSAAVDADSESKDRELGSEEGEKSFEEYESEGEEAAAAAAGGDGAVEGVKVDGVQVSQRLDTGFYCCLSEDIGDDASLFLTQ